MIVLLKALGSGQFHLSKIFCSYVDPSQLRYCAVMATRLVKPEMELALLGPAAGGPVAASGPGAGARKYLYGTGNAP